MAMGATSKSLACPGFYTPSMTSLRVLLSDEWPECIMSQYSDVLYSNVDFPTDS